MGFVILAYAVFFFFLYYFHFNWWQELIAFFIFYFGTISYSTAKEAVEKERKRQIDELKEQIGLIEEITIFTRDKVEEILANQESVDLPPDNYWDRLDWEENRKN